MRRNFYRVNLLFCEWCVFGGGMANQSDEVFQLTRILANQAQICCVCTRRYYPELDSVDYDSRIYCSLKCRERVGTECAEKFEWRENKTVKLERDGDDYVVRGRMLIDLSDPEILDALFPPARITSADLKITDEMLADADFALPGVVYAVGGLKSEKPEGTVIPNVVARWVARRVARWTGKLRDWLGCLARRWCTPLECLCGGCTMESDW